MRVVGLLLLPLLLPLLLLPLLLLPASGEVACNETGQYSRDGAACCGKCPPGEFLTDRCTADSPTRCQPCPLGTFTSNWNTVQRCEPCRRCNTDFAQVWLLRCSPDRDTVCGCLAGFHESRGTDRGSVFRCCPNCPPGFGSLIPCDLVTEIACRPCPAGSYGEGTDGKCRPCTTCLGAERTKCSSSSDSVCIPVDARAQALSSSSGSSGGSSSGSSSTSSDSSSDSSSSAELLASAAIGATASTLLLVSLSCFLRARKRRRRVSRGRPLISLLAGDSRVDRSRYLHTL